MIIEGKVLSATQGKDGITSLTILTKDIDDHISWVGQVIKAKLMEYELKEKVEETI